jgi:hypothetical protein
LTCFETLTMILFSLGRSACHHRQGEVGGCCPLPIGLCGFCMQHRVLWVCMISGQGSRCVTSGPTWCVQVSGAGDGRGPAGGGHDATKAGGSGEGRRGMREGLFPHTALCATNLGKGWTFGSVLEHLQASQAGLDYPGVDILVHLDGWAVLGWVLEPVLGRCVLSWHGSLGPSWASNFNASVTTPHLYARTTNPDPTDSPTQALTARFLARAGGRLAVSEEPAPGGGVAADLREGAAGHVAAPRLPPLAHHRATPRIPRHPTPAEPQGGLREVF